MGNLLLAEFFPAAKALMGIYTSFMLNKIILQPGRGNFDPLAGNLPMFLNVAFLNLLLAMDFASESGVKRCFVTFSASL